MDTSTPVVLLSLTSDLELTLRALLDRTLESVLPNDIQQRLLRHPKLCSNSDEGMGQVLEKEMVEMHRSAATSAEESPTAETELQNKPIGDETYIERSLLVDIAKWARHPKSSKSLRRSHLDPHDYSLIALCAGTKTYITPAQRRLITSNPQAASSFLPSHLVPPDPQTSTLGIGHEYRLASKELSAAANILFSVGGVGGAIWWVCQSSAGMSREVSTLLALLAAMIVLFAEMWLYISQSSRVAKARIAEGEARRNEPVVGIKGMEDAEGLEVLENRRERGVEQEDVVEDAVEDMTGWTEGEEIGVVPVTTLGAVDETLTTTVRLRRKPLSSSAS